MGKTITAANIVFFYNSFTYITATAAHTSNYIADVHQADSNNNCSDNTLIDMTKILLKRT